MKEKEKLRKKKRRILGKNQVKIPMKQWDLIKGRRDIYNRFKNNTKDDKFYEFKKYSETLDEEKMMNNMIFFFKKKDEYSIEAYIPLNANELFDADEHGDFSINAKNNFKNENGEFKKGMHRVVFLKLIIENTDYGYYNISDMKIESFDGKQFELGDDYKNNNKEYKKLIEEKYPSFRETLLDIKDFLAGNFLYYYNRNVFEYNNSKTVLGYSDVGDENENIIYDAINFYDDEEELEKKYIESKKKYIKNWDLIDDDILVRFTTNITKITSNISIPSHYFYAANKTNILRLFYRKTFANYGTITIESFWNPGDEHLSYKYSNNKNKEIVKSETFIDALKSIEKEIGQDVIKNEKMLQNGNYVDVPDEDRLFYLATATKEQREARKVRSDERTKEYRRRAEEAEARRVEEVKAKIAEEEAKKREQEEARRIEEEKE